MTGFFEHTRTRRMSSPPAVLPKRQERTPMTTEVYRHTVYTPSVEMQMVPGVHIEDLGNGYTGMRNGQIVVQPSQVNGQTVNETVLVLEGYAR